MRLDKWLWAARFFKTRSLAKEEVQRGHVRLNGQRVKSSRVLQAGDLVEIQKGWTKSTVQVLALSEHRRTANEAMQLYEETEESKSSREREVALRKAQHAGFELPKHRPDKKDRRALSRMKRG